jgi:hypothetical protein
MTRLTAPLNLGLGFRAGGILSTATMPWALLALLAGCNAVGTVLSVENRRTTDTIVHVAFGDDSKITGSDWPFCAGPRGGTCSFLLAAGASRDLPLAGAYLNATLSFDKSGCGATKAEVNINNPAWYDVLDVSLVDGYNEKVQIDVSPPGLSPVTLGPPVGETGNEKVFGLFPYGCDLCVSRGDPPCGISKGSDGCKTGPQFDPDVPCQWQGPKKGGGGQVVVALVP